MENKDAFCISRNNAFIIGFVILLIGIALFANFVNSRQLSDRSRASGTDLNSLPASGYAERVKEVSNACSDIKGYLARQVVSDTGTILFDRFTGYYYSIEKVNPVVTPPPGKLLAGYCATSGVPGGNWCKTITTPTACNADCAWITKGSCALCAPKGADARFICP